LGGERNQFQFINDNRGFGGQHDARVLSNGNIALFDNGLYLIPEYSSYVEYELDEQNHTATLIRRYSRNGSIFSAKKGGVQELPNGNIVISWDGILNPFVSEISPEDSTVYEVRYDNSISQYRAYRFPWKTNLFSIQYDSLDFGIVTVNNSSSIEIIIYNRGEDSVIINEVFNKDSSFYVNENLPIIIAPNDSVAATIIFEPIENGSFTDKINFRSATDTLLIAQQVFVEGTTYLVSVGEEINKANDYSLSQNYPNPFNPKTIMKFTISSASSGGFVSLKIYDVLGNEIETLVNEKKAAGSYKVEFKGEELTSGIYFYQLRVYPAGGGTGDPESSSGQGFVETKKMLLIK